MGGPEGGKRKTNCGKIGGNRAPQGPPGTARALPQPSRAILGSKKKTSFWLKMAARTGPSGSPQRSSIEGK